MLAGPYRPLRVSERPLAGRDESERPSPRRRVRAPNMAAAEGERDSLPAPWSYGVCRDGRVFFVNDQTRSTTWLHPRTGEPVNSGHMIRSDLPRGWEEGFTEEGAGYFIDHNQKTTTFRHPVTGQVSPENLDFDIQEEHSSPMLQQQANQRPSSMVSESSTAVTTSTTDAKLTSKPQKLSNKVHSFGKRDHSIKRNPNVPVVVRGWLHKQDSSGMRLWKRRWFVLTDHCLFYYKDSREEAVLGSIPLPSYVISPVGLEDRISRKYSFKAVHTGMRAYFLNKSTIIGSQSENSGMRTYYFSADTQEDMNAWIRAMNQAALLQTHSGFKRDMEIMEWQAALPQANHLDSYKGCAEAQVVHRKEYFAKADETFSFGNRKDKRKERENEERYTFKNDILEGKPGKPKHSEVNLVYKELVPRTSRSRTAQPQPLEKNGTLPNSLNVGASPVQYNGTDGYKRGITPRATNQEKETQRKTNIAQVEHWVKVQKGDPKSLASDHTLTRHAPNQTLSSSPENCQTLPKNTRQSLGSSPPPQNRNLPSDYKYAQDRISHFKMSNEDRKASKEGTVWQLYEWQQRQQFKHGSPTGPLYIGSIDFIDRGKGRSSLDVPRSISIPPSPSDILLTAPLKAYPPKRPHTPAERVTVKPTEEEWNANTNDTGSPRKMQTQTLKAATHVDRRSMPSMGYMTHTVSAPSLHGKSPEELTLLLIRLRRHQAMLAGVRNYTIGQLQQYAPTNPTYQADDTYMQLKKDLEYLDLKVTGQESLKDRTSKPVRIAESDVDVKLSKLCEQDGILRDLEDKLRILKDNKDKLESVLEVLHRQMEQYNSQPQHVENIAYQQRLLQEDLVQIRAEISKVSTEMENGWNEYRKLENDVDHLKQALQEEMSKSYLSQEKTKMQRDLWRIEDVTAGLSANKANYKVIIGSMKNPERKNVPLFHQSSVPSASTSFRPKESRAAHRQSPPLSPVKSTLEVRLFPKSQPQPFTQPPPQVQTQQLRKTEPLLQSPTKLSPKEDEAPPRPPLPQMYSPDDQPPAVPPLPKEATVIRHTSVRGLKRQSDERKRDRELGQYVNGDYKVELRSYMSEPELANMADDLNQTAVFEGPENGYQTLPGRGLSGSTSRLHQSSTVSSYVTLRRGLAVDGSKEDRPKSALERLYSGDHQRSKMSAEEQLKRMKRHQKALVRERKRTLSQGDRQPAPSRSFIRPISADIGSWKREQDFDLQLLERAARDAEEKEKNDEGWLKVQAVPVTEVDLEPLDYDLDISKELSKPEKVAIPERYIELEPEEPLSSEELEARYRRVEKIKNLLARSSMHTMPPSISPDEHSPIDVDSQLQEQERMITISYALASEASQRSKQVAAKAVSEQ
uniref:Pleckstrin homology domain-containing family A member 7 isoform X2 n=1 Tax=Geotrypetes seraphini TaxID=260995 RepID=A0A6P8QAI6_GEOSA|nr:pleckstrin homology domain-containing family A member 7 isoform X2 [Geotrypetes seraphini]